MKTYGYVRSDIPLAVCKYGCCYNRSFCLHLTKEYKKSKRKTARQKAKNQIKNNLC